MSTAVKPSPLPEQRQLERLTQGACAQSAGWEDDSARKTFPRSPRHSPPFSLPLTGRVTSLRPPRSYVSKAGLLAPPSGPVERCSGARRAQQASRKSAAGSAAAAAAAVVVTVARRHVAARLSGAEGEKGEGTRGEGREEARQGGGRGSSGGANRAEQLSPGPLSAQPPPPDPAGRAGASATPGTTQSGLRSPCWGTWRRDGDLGTCSGAAAGASASTSA